MVSSIVQEQLKRLPSLPGVYLMKDVGGNVIYVGKATSLRQRVRSYFSPRQQLSPKTERLVNRVNSLDFWVTTTEQEALVLELNLIKRYRPRYNIRLKDNKTFPYLKIDLNEDWPTVRITRRPEDDGSRYFGPFASTKSVRQALRVIKGIFPFRSCNQPITGTAPHPCLEYHLHRCLGPCIGAVSREEYHRLIGQVSLFLEGKQEGVLQELESEMKQAAETLDFEQAGRLRDRIRAVKRVIEWQRIATVVTGEQDVIAFVQDRDYAYVQVFLIRAGRLIGKEGFILEGTRAEEPPQIMASFIKQYYNSATYVPPQLWLQYPVDEVSVIEGWLQGKRGARVRLKVPCRGDKKQLVMTVAENARRGLEQLRIKQLATPRALGTALAEIKKELHLSCLPARLEGYDISNIQGRLAVGSMVVFENGRPKPSHYRRFRIKTVPQADDYAMLYEMLNRRFKRHSGSDSWAIQPDLILIDGGKGQLNAALSAMTRLGVTSVPIASLAKQNEEIFVPYRDKPIVLPRNSPGLQLLQRLRDESHRFAISYHRQIRRRAGIASALDDIPGIGPKRKRALLRQFGSVSGIRSATEGELAAARGINRGLAKRVKGYL
ncbi:MAG: excinuclease ABC subunit UvrC [Dehalococcoidales bacterium]|nr:excinuclease ABC subunit UvrC [Dehalococcoidales bacterium]